MKYADEGRIDLWWLAFVLLTLFITHTLAHADTEIEQQIIQSARHAGISPTLALAIADVESGMNPDAVGTLGEVGVFQLRPGYHAVVKGDVQQNIELAIQYLADLKLKCAGYGDAYFVCFNYGYTRRLKYPRRFPYYRKVKLAERRRIDAFAVARTDR